MTGEITAAGLTTCTLMLEVWPAALAAGQHKFAKLAVGQTWRLLCSSFWAMTCYVLRAYDILPQKELHRILQ